MSIMNYNGGSCLAMSGKECYVIASDNRLGMQFQTLAMNVSKLHAVNGRTMVGLSGLRTDQLTLSQKLNFRLEMFKLEEAREISGEALCGLLSTMLYEHRFSPLFVEPIVASLDPTGRVYLAGLDLIGAPCEPCDYVATGTCAESLHGMAESLWAPELDPEKLFEITCQALLSSCDRDSLSGYGATVKIVTKDKIITRIVKGRKD